MKGTMEERKRNRRDKRRVTKGKERKGLGGNSGSTVACVHRRNVALVIIQCITFSPSPSLSLLLPSFACPDRDVVLDAQSPLAGWYAGHGFAVDGTEFLEDGIPHLPMRRSNKM